MRPFSSDLGSNLADQRKGFYTKGTNKHVVSPLHFTGIVHKDLCVFYNSAIDHFRVDNSLRRLCEFGDLGKDEAVKTRDTS